MHSPWGTAGRRAKVPLARPNLAEAVSKTLAWRTETRGGAAAARHHFRGWGGDVSSPWPPSQPRTSWDETSQPHPDPQLPRGRRRLGAAAAALPHPSPRPLPRVGRDAFHRVPVLPLNIRDLVEQVLTQIPRPPPNPKLTGTRRPSPHPDANCFGVGDVPSPNLPRHRNPRLPGTRRPSPHPDPQLLRSSSSVRDFLLCPSPNPSSKP